MGAQAHTNNDGICIFIKFTLFVYAEISVLFKKEKYTHFHIIKLVWRYQCSTFFPVNQYKRKIPKIPCFSEFSPSARQIAPRHREERALCAASARKFRRIHRIAGKGIGAGIRHGEVHLRRLGGAKILIGAGILDFVEGIPEHLVVGFLPV